MLPMRSEQHKVLWSVVLFVAIAMMDFFAFAESAANCGFHDDNVFANIPVRVGATMSLLEHKAVAVLDDKWLASRGRVAVVRAIPRPIARSGSDDDLGSAIATRPAALLPPTGHRTEVARAARDLTWRAIETSATAGARNVRRQCGTSLCLNSSHLCLRRLGVSMQSSNGVITRLAAENSRQLESRRREVHLATTRRTVPSHILMIHLPRGRWSIPDLGHFEYLPPADRSTQA